MGLDFRDTIPEEQIQRTKIQDVIQRITTLKWAGYKARTQNGRWIRRLLEWRAKYTKISETSIHLKRAARNWIQIA